MNIIKKILIIVSTAVIFIAVAGFWVLPVLLKPAITGKISEMLHRQTSIEQIRINPFAPSVTIKGFKLAQTEKENVFIAFEELHVNAAFLASIVRRALILEEIRLHKPYIGITRKDDGSYNFSDLIPAQASKKDESSRPFLFSFNNIRISDGDIDFHDRPHKTDHTVRKLNILIPFLSNIDHYAKNYVEPRFSAVVNGKTISIDGKTRPFLASRETSFNIDLQDIDIPYYLQYVPIKMNFKLIEARLDTNLQLNFIMHADKSPEVKLTGQSAVRNVALDDLRGNKILRLPALRVDIASVEPFSRGVHLSQIAFEAPQLVVRRAQNGKVNLLELIASDKKNEQTIAGAAQDETERHDKKKNELSLLIDRLLIDKADITFIDEKPSPPVNIQMNPLNVNVTRLSLKKGESADMDLNMTINKKGNIAVKGSLGIEPLFLDLALEMKNLAIHTFQPYFTESVQMDVTRGSIAAAGKLSLALDAQGKPGLRYEGNLSVFDLATIDRVKAHDFLKWKQLSFQSLRAGYNPLFADIQEISLKDFFAKIVINDGGGTNIQDIFSAPEKAAESPKSSSAVKSPQPAHDTKPAAPPPNVKIGKVSFQGGIVDFTDHNIKPNYSVTMLNLKGSVTGLSSQEISRAKVDLQGNIGYGSPLEIIGAINPLKQDLFADIKISFKDLEMTQATPYTVKFLGYPVIKGKLNFNVAYLVDKKKLSAENKIFFDQLTFGEKVESPTAIKAPVPLAVSLLTDRSGQINLDIPLSGSLDDPKFKIWPLVWQILVNLITKAVTAPFSLLSSLTGQGEEMSFVEFDYGGAALTEAGLKKIGALGKALYDRPNLKLDIEGYVDPAQDGQVLQNAGFHRLLKAQKLKEMIDQGQTSVGLDEVAIAPAEYEKYLTRAYKAAKFAKPRNVLGIAKTLPPAEMEKLMFENTVISEGDLIGLAARRAQTVREQLLQDGKIEQGRIFLVKPPALTPEKKEKVKDARVEFKLR